MKDFGYVILVGWRLVRLIPVSSFVEIAIWQQLLKIVKACSTYAELIETEAGTLEDIQNEFFDISQE